MNKTLWLVLIVLAIVVFSCGSKKRIVERAESSSIKIESNKVSFKERADISINHTVFIDENTITFTPINSDKPMITGGVTTINSKITIDKKNSREHFEKKEKTSKKAGSSVYKKKLEKSEIKNVEVEKKPSFIKMILLLIPILILFFALRKKKKKEE